MYPAIATFSSAQHDAVQEELAATIGPAKAAEVRGQVDAEHAANVALFSAVRERDFPQWRVETPPQTEGWAAMMLTVTATVKVAIAERDATAAGGS